MSTAAKRRTTTEDDITAEALRRFDATPNPRLRQIMHSLVKHLHAFVKDVQLTEAEWFAGIKFLTDTGHMCDDLRQEFILLSDTLGVSMVVDLITHRKPEGATESTVFGPFYRPGAPELPPGGNMCPTDTNGTPAIISGRVVDQHGHPIAGALLDVWQANSQGFYDSQLETRKSCRCAASIAPTRTGSSSSAPIVRLCTRFRPTARWARCSWPRTATGGVRRTCTSSSPPMVSNRSRRTSSIRSIGT